MCEISSGSNETPEGDLDLLKWQKAHIEEGIAQADRGDFSSDDEIRRIFAKWKSGEDYP